MKVVLVLLVLCVVTLLVVLGAMWWHLRRRLRQSDESLKNTLNEISPEHEPVEHK